MGQHLEEGIDLFNRGEYFRAHEEFEAIWLAAKGPSRPLYQGLVQACAGLLKIERGERTGALRLLERALANLREGGREGMPEPRVLDLARFIRDLETAAASCAGGGPVTAPAIRR